MNEDVKCVVKSSVLLSCCNEDKKCESCIPMWQRTIIIDDSLRLWFPIIGMTNKVLKKLIKSEFGMLIDRANGAWYVEQDLALEIALNKQEEDNLKDMIVKIINKYNSSLEEADKVAEVDELA